ncbi:PRP19B, partial [Symbiodinium microadriaticum]
VWRPAGDGSSYSEAFTFTSHSEEVTGVCVHPTERFAASVSRDGTWCFLDVTRGACLMQKGSDDEDPAAAPYSCGRFHPDGLLLAAGTTGGAVRIWDIREQKSAANCADHAGSGAVLSLSFSENGYLFASGGEDGSAHIWDLRKLQAVKSLPTGDGGAVTAVAFDLSGTYLAMGSSKGSVSTTVVKEWTELT